jgi:hypothetical protein
MNPEVVFATMYASLIVLAAMGIDHVGRAGARRRSGAKGTGDQREQVAWPHLGSVALHSAVAAVACAAGILIALVVGLRHHGGPDIAILSFPVLFATAELHRLHGQLRSTFPH